MDWLDVVFDVFTPDLGRRGTRLVVIAVAVLAVAVLAYLLWSRASSSP